MHDLRENTARNTASTQRSVYSVISFDLGDCVHSTVLNTTVSLDLAQMQNYGPFLNEISVRNVCVTNKTVVRSVFMTLKSFVPKKRTTVTKELISSIIADG